MKMRSTLDMGKYKIIVTGEYNSKRNAIYAVLRAGYRGETDIDEIMKFIDENIDRVTVEVLE